MRDPDRDIALQNPNRYPDVLVRRLRPWLERLIGTLAPQAASLGVRFCGDRAMRRANRQYRSLDKTTDVLSFPGDPHPRPLSRHPTHPRWERGASAPPSDTGHSLFPGRGEDAAGEGGRGGEGLHLGDILISVPAARRQAAAAGHTVERELEILLLHGVLHCLGYDHETDDGQMARLERRLRRTWIAAPPGESGGSHA